MDHVNVYMVQSKFVQNSLLNANFECVRSKKGSMVVPFCNEYKEGAQPLSHVIDKNHNNSATKQVFHYI